MRTKHQRGHNITQSTLDRRRRIGGFSAYQRPPLLSQDEVVGIWAPVQVRELVSEFLLTKFDVCGTDVPSFSLSGSIPVLMVGDDQGLLKLT